MASINSVLTYNANLSPAQAQIKALTGQIGTLTAAFNTLDKSAVRAQSALASTFLANVGQIGGFTTQMVQSGTAVDNFGKSLAKQRLTMRQYFREAIAGYTKQNSMMKQLAAQQVRMQQSMMVPMGAGPGGTGRAAVLTPTSVGAMGTAAAMASQKFSIFNELVRGGSERLLNFGKNTQWTGRQLMVGFTLPLVLFTALVSKQFREIDKELTRFEKVYGGDLVGTVEGATERMREQVKQLAYDISSSYGIAAKETAALAADIAQTGKEGEDLIASVKQTTRLAVLGEVERQEAMRATLSIQNAFKLNTNELSEAIDFLNAVENQTSTNLQDLAGAIPRVGPVIQALGGDIKDMSLLLVAMREGGVSAAEAANALKSGLGRLINPTQRARDVAASFGISLEDIIKNSQGQLLPMIFGLQDALNGINEFGRAQVLEKVFGKYQFARMSALFANLRRQGSQTLQVMELASASSSELAGIANKELRALQESSAMRFQRTIENLKNSLIPLGNMLTETLIPILSAIGGGIKSFMDFFQALPEPIKNFSKYAIALTAIAGPVVMLVGLFGNLIANGIKFGMMIVRLGARVAGLRFEKFELLTADVIAARQGVDNLTTSFTTQEAALKRLSTALSTYATNIGHLMRTNPQLFAAGMMPRGVPVIRRQKGSRSPEVVPGGYGGGDKIPALLEPGEFVVRKEAASKYGPILASMNRGDLQGFSNGTPEQQWRARYDKEFKTGQANIRPGSEKEGKRYSRPEGIVRAFGHVPPVAGVAMARGHIAGVSAMKPVRIGTADLGWHPTLWMKVAQAENQLLNALQASAGNRAALQTALKEVQTDPARIRRIMHAVANGVMIHANDMDAYEKALIHLQRGNAQLFGRAPALLSQSLREASVLRSSGHGALAMRGVTTAELRSAQQLQVAQYRALSKQVGPGSDPLLLKARNELAQKILVLQDYFRKLGLEAEKIPKTLLSSIKKHSRQASPSKEAERVGKNLSDGFILGARAVDGRPAGQELANETVAGVRSVSGLTGGMTAARLVSPVGAGLESRSLRSQILAKEKSILDLTAIQEKAARIRVIAEGQIANIQQEIKKTMARSDLSMKERLAITEKLKADILAQRAIIDSSSAAEKRASDNLTKAKNDLAALIRRTPPPTFFTPGMATVGTAGGVSGLAVMGGVTGNKTATTNTVGITSTARPSSPTMTMGGTGAKTTATTSMGRSGTVSVQGLKPTPSPAAAVRTGPAASIRSAQQSAAKQPGMGGMGAMNALFMLSMMTSSFAMLGGQSNDLSMKLGILTSAVMAASMAMMMFSGRNVMGNFLGLRSLGGKLGNVAATRAAAQGTTVASSLATRAPMAVGAGGALTKLGGGLATAARALSVLGGPVGIAAGLAVTGLVTGFMILKKRAEEARERLISAFADPTKTAEYFGQSIEDVNKTIEMNKMANITTDMGEVSEDLRKVVKEDYEKLIDRLQETTSIVGARELSVAFASMITSGISAENARAAIEAIAVEAGEKGGKAFAEAMGKNLLDIETVEDSVNVIAGQFDPTKNKELAKSISQYKMRIEELKQSREDILRSAASDQESRPTRTYKGDRARPGDVLPGGFRSVFTEVDGVRRSLILTNEEYRKIADSLKEIQEIELSLEEIFDISPDKLIPSVEQLIMAYSEAPQEVAQALSTIQEEVLSSTDKQGDYFNEIKNFLNEAYSEDMEKYGHSIDTVEEAVAALKLVTSGVSLSRAINDADQFDSRLAGIIYKAKTLADVVSQARMVAEEEYFGMIDQFFAERRIEIQADLDVNQEELDTLKDTIESKIFGEGEFISGTDIQIRSAMERAERSLELNRRATEEQNRLSEERIDLIEEEKEAQEEKYDQEIEALENEREAIEESTEAYIKSIQKRQQIDSFYANQRKTAFSALEKLAAGDVFGFLQEREQMSQDAQQFAYDEQIKSIEEREERELELIDNAMDAREKEHEEYKKMMDERIQLERDQIDERNKSMEAAERNHQQLVDNYNEQVLVATATAEAERDALQQKLSDIAEAENNYRTDAKAAEEKYSKEYAELKSAPYVEARKEFMKLRVEEIFFRGGVTLADAIMQAGISIGDRKGRSAADALNDIAEELGIIFSPGVPYANRPATLSDIYNLPGGELPDTGVAPPFSAEDVTIQDPQNVYINGVDVTDSSGQSGGYNDPGGAGTAAARGGYISGPGTPTSDSIPARLSNGEYVIRASSVSKYGRGMMDAINEARFAEGGPVGDSFRPSAGMASPKFISGRNLPNYVKPPEPTTQNNDPTSSNSYTPPGGSYGGPVTESGLGFAAARYAVSQQGKPYSMNAQPPNSWDCSKLTAWSWNNGSGAPAGKYSLTAYSHSQANEITKKVTSRGANMPIDDRFSVGDILYFRGIGSQSGGHTSMYVGNGKVFEASSPSIGLRYSDLNNSWNRRYFAWGGTPIPNFATGGFVTGPGGSMSDKIPAMLSNGEYVVRANAVDKYGKGMLDQINAGQFGMGGMVQQYGRGGSVPSMAYSMGGMVSSPTYSMPSMSNTSVLNSSPNTSNTVSMDSSDNNVNNNVKIIINAQSGQSANAIANKVVNIINSSNNRRNHSRSLK